MTCCYAQSAKQWVADPQGVHWETFYSYGESTVYGARSAQQELEQITAQGACGYEPAAPAAKTAAACCAG